MSTIEATMSMMEAMPEDARIKVMEYAQKLFTSRKPANPFVSLTTEQILSDLDKAHKQIEEGKGVSADAAMAEMGRRHGFI
ncbi:MAG: hypothetical protein LUD16_12925 [Lachnospiraceae bacterium]|nr:hypothetical protein [Lachnospiraceae bacterium]MCD8348815.1 hypothetical protein [Lachnospiraceae bacterium]